MRIVVNGKGREVADEITIAELIDDLSLQPLRVAVERNKQLVPRASHVRTTLFEDDQLEIVTLVGGG